MSDFASKSEMRRVAAQSPMKMAERYATLERDRDELLAALVGLMALESRGRVMPIGKEWDAARAVLAKHAATGGEG